jgi:regulator of telomere elongation helicase 1
MKDRAACADVIFMPYNYLVDEKIRENFDINFQNTILIFDEAHNITSTCEE